MGSTTIVNRIVQERVTTSAGQQHEGRSANSRPCPRKTAASPTSSVARTINCPRRLRSW